MAQQLISIGNAPNDGSGDSLRVSAIKTNENFTELYSKVNNINTYTLPIASATILGGVKIDTNTINLSPAGVISVTMPSPGNALPLPNSVANAGTSLLYARQDHIHPYDPVVVIPSGAIIMWSGLLNTIPSGWVLCDGSNGTPDLRDSFIVGAGNKYNPKNTGGRSDAVIVSHTHTASSTFTGSPMTAHTHTITDPGHVHALPDSANPSGDGAYFDSATGTITRTFDTTSALTGVSVNSASAGTPSGTVTTTVDLSGVDINTTPDTNLPPYVALAFIMKL